MYRPDQEKQLAEAIANGTWGSKSPVTCDHTAVVNTTPGSCVAEGDLMTTGKPNAIEMIGVSRRVRDALGPHDERLSIEEAARDVVQLNVPGSALDIAKIVVTGIDAGEYVWDVFRRAARMSGPRTVDLPPYIIGLTYVGCKKVDMYTAEKDGRSARYGVIDIDGQHVEIVLSDEQADQLRRSIGHRYELMMRLVEVRK